MSRPWLKQRTPKFIAEIEANLLPVMNIMFLLIPALLLAMEFASMAAIPITPPSRCGGCGVPDSETPRALNFSLEILEDGFRTKLNGEAQGEIIPLRAGTHDFAALAAEAAMLKQGYPYETRVTDVGSNTRHLARQRLQFGRRASR